MKSLIKLHLPTGEYPARIGCGTIFILIIFLAVTELVAAKHRRTEFLNGELRHTDGRRLGDFLAERGWEVELIQDPHV